jgi:hypothetical protein
MRVGTRKVMLITYFNARKIRMKADAKINILSGIIVMAARVMPG